MTDIAKRATFHAGGRGVRTFHIETDGCIVNITVGLTMEDGRAVTRVDISPDDETRGGDGEGRIWHRVDDARIVREHPAEPSTD